MSDVDGWRPCPFDECDWSTAEPIHEVEADVLAGGWDRLALHLQMMHGAFPEPDEGAWGAGDWMVALFPLPDEFRLPLSSEEADEP